MALRLQLAVARRRLGGHVASQRNAIHITVSSAIVALLCSALHCNAMRLIHPRPACWLRVALRCAVWSSSPPLSPLPVSACVCVCIRTNPHAPGILLHVVVGESSCRVEPITNRKGIKREGRRTPECAKRKRPKDKGQRRKGRESKLRNQTHSDDPTKHRLVKEPKG